MATPIFGEVSSMMMTAATDPALNAAVSASIIDTYGGVVITLTAPGNVQTLATTGNLLPGKTFTIVNNDTSNNSIVVNGITVPVGKSQSFIWDGTAWGPVDLGITSLPVPVNQGGTGSITGNVSGLDFTTTPVPAAFTSVNWAKPANIADSATPAIGAAAGNVLDLDGATTITAFDNVAAGATRYCRFTGVRVLTYNATSLILPGFRNITTAVGDRASFISLGSGNWYCFAYLKASGIAVGNTDEQIVASTGTLSNPNAYGAFINNYGQTADCNITLPAAAKGMNFVFTAGTTAAFYYRFTPATGDIISLDGVQGVANKYVQFTSVNKLNSVAFYTTQTGAATWEWAAMTISGALTVQA